MKTIIKLGVVLFLMVVSATGFAQKKDKKVITFSVERVINASADQVWKVVGNDFGAIANSHPKVVSSYYNQGYITGGENASRTCNFNEKGTKYLKETQVDFDAENYTFKVRIDNTSGIPLNNEYSYGIYKVIPIDANSSKFMMTIGFRAKPAFLGALAKGQYKRDIADYMLAVEYHVLTGENVNKENFKEIRKKYSK